MQQAKAFSLAEMSIVMVIVGFIASSAISVAISSDYTTKRDETETKMLRIEEALAGFLATNRRLPCPASGITAVDLAAFGVEQVSGSNPQACIADFSVAVGGSTVWGGVVPVTTLQLPDDFMYDGWGRRINYIVDYKFTNNEIINNTCVGVSGNICFRDTVAGTITVQDESHSAPHRTTIAVYVLHSSGENGHGAFPRPGVAKTARLNGFPTGNPYRDATASADEFTNAKADNTGTNTAYAATFIMRDYIRNDDITAAASARTYFDDLVRYKTKEQLVKAAGFAIFGFECNTALAIINGANDCTGAVEPAQCETFATEVYSSCLK